MTPQEAINETSGMTNESERMERIDELLGNFGVEAIRDPEEWRNYYCDIVAEYSNTGDSYAETVLYDVARGEFLVTSWADWLEDYEINVRKLP